MSILVKSKEVCFIIKFKWILNISLKEHNTTSIKKIYLDHESSNIVLSF